LCWGAFGTTPQTERASNFMAVFTQPGSDPLAVAASLGASAQAADTNARRLQPKQAILEIRSNRRFIDEPFFRAPAVQRAAAFPGPAGRD
jgi:hypothetical protein